MPIRAASCLLLMALLPSVSAGQATGGPQLTPAESEAYQMGLEMTFVCNPPRHRSMEAESVSSISRPRGGLDGTATYLRSAEGTFLVLEGYDEEMAGHCVVLAWFGPDLQVGSYQIRRLAMGAMEEEVGSGRHSFFVLGAVRSPAESSMLIADSGTVELSAVDGGTVRGRFQVVGFAVEGTARTDGVEWEGSFAALERDP